MSMAKRSYDKEIMDRDDIPFADIEPTLRELNVINTLLGGHKITQNGVHFFLNQVRHDHSLSIAEIGCGGGDNLAAVGGFLKKRNQLFILTGIDIKEECIQCARQNCTDEITWICSDYRTAEWPGAKPDIVFSSLFCHHFTDGQLVEQMRWMRENSRLGFFINDLHRHPLAYYSIMLITKSFSKSYLVKNDAPLSVKRGFKKRDWVKLLSIAGITNYSIKWQWAFRYLICVSNEQ